MERYDFTVNADLAGNVPEELDRLTNKEMIAVHEAIQQIKQNTETEATTKHMEWFDTAILPVLKGYQSRLPLFLILNGTEKCSYKPPSVMLVG